MSSVNSRSLNPELCLSGANHITTLLVLQELRKLNENLADVKLLLTDLRRVERIVVMDEAVNKAQTHLRPPLIA